MRTNALIKSNINSFFLIVFSIEFLRDYLSEEAYIDYIFEYSFYLKKNHH